MELLYGAFSVTALILLTGWIVKLIGERKKFVLTSILFLIALYLGAWVSIMTTFGYQFAKQTREESHAVLPRG